MKIKQYRTQFIKELASYYDAYEAESFFYLILEEKKKLKQIHIALNPELEFSSEEIDEWNESLEQLKKEIPIQYLLGKTSFFGLTFNVNPNVLIPRPETEELVDWIISRVVSDYEKDQSIKILDIGTGSGCIAISLAKNLPQAKVYALDVSEGALQTAAQNAVLNSVEVNFIHKSILEVSDLEMEFDVIVSNPPYVRNLEKEEIKNNVLENEPHLALFVADDNALVFYDKISDLAKKSLVVGGKLFFEINQYLGKEMVELLGNKGFQEVELRKDIYGNDRMTCAVQP